MGKKQAVLKKARRTADTASPRLARGPILNRDELETFVVREFCSGTPVSQIPRVVKDKLGIDLKREAPWRILSEAAQKRRFAYRPRGCDELTERMSEKYPWLKSRVEVVSTAMVEDVARCGAEQLMKLVQSHHLGNLKSRRFERPDAGERTSEVHIGFAGSRCMKMVAEEFAALLVDPPSNLPDLIYFHAMSVGFSLEEPTYSPIYFFSVFADKAVQQRVKTRLVGFNAPGLADNNEIKIYRQSKEIRHSFKEAEKLNIIVTSAGAWGDAHSAFKTYLDKEYCEFLDRNNCIGDMFWHPLFPIGDVVHPPFEALTIKGPNELPAFIKEGGDVLLVLGPCGLCRRSKGDVLARILENKPQLITHLVVDSQSSREVCTD